MRLVSETPRFEVSRITYIWTDVSFQEHSRLEVGNFEFGESKNTFYGVVGNYHIPLTFLSKTWNCLVGKQREVRVFRRGTFPLWSPQSRVQLSGGC